MRTIFIMCALVSVVVTLAGASDQPEKLDPKVVPISKATLIGKWNGPKDCPMILDFNDDKVKVTVPGSDDGTTQPTTVEWDYTIDAKENMVLLQPLDITEGASVGAARLKADGTLSVLIVRRPPLIPKLLKDVTFTRANPEKRKK